LEGRCPHCHQPAAAGGHSTGEIVDCAHCDRSYVIPDGIPDEPEPAPPPSSAAAIPRLTPLDMVPAPAEGRSIPSQVRLTTTGPIALGLTGAFYLALVTPLGETSFGQLFAERGWVPYVISFLAFWSGVLLAMKYRRLSRQTRVLELDLLPREIVERITPESAQRFLDVLRALPAEQSDNFLVQRVCRALEYFRTRANVAETVDQLRAQRERDEAGVESSYTMLRVFIWAIPILGFIGTVLGIGQSVGGFSESVGAAVDLEVMKDSIGAVTSGLGVAFDTTLIALVMSIFIMFPTSSLQKAEEDFLGEVDDYCQEHLVARLEGGEGGQGAVADALVVRVAERLAEELLAALERRQPRVH
jgi:biopolymer transport protein ExbB/TolQ